MEGLISGISRYGNFGPFEILNKQIYLKKDINLFKFENLSFFEKPPKSLKQMDHDSIGQLSTSEHYEKDFHRHVFVMSSLEYSSFLK